MIITFSLNLSRPTTEMKRCSSPLVAVALLLLLVVCSCFHCAAAARILQPAVPLPVIAHHENDGAKAAAAVADGGLILESGAVVSGDEHELSSVSEVLGAAESEEEGAVVCEDGNDECLQRRLLRDAHLDYIYTQHKGRP